MGTLGFHHLALSVSNLPLTVGFFTDCLGWTVEKDDLEYTSTYVTNGLIIISLWQTDKAHNKFNFKKNVGLHHFSIKVDSEKNLYAIFDKAAIFPNTEVEFAPVYLKNKLGKHCMIFEPSGILIELIWSP